MRWVRGLVGDWAGGRHGRNVLLLLLQVRWCLSARRWELEPLAFGAFSSCRVLAGVSGHQNPFRTTWPRVQHGTWGSDSTGRVENFSTFYGSKHSADVVLLDDRGWTFVSQIDAASYPPEMSVTHEMAPRHACVPRKGNILYHDRACVGRTRLKTDNHHPLPSLSAAWRADFAQERSAEEMKISRAIGLFTHSRNMLNMCSLSPTTLPVLPREPNRC